MSLQLKKADKSYEISELLWQECSASSAILCKSLASKRIPFKPIDFDRESGKIMFAFLN